MSISDPIKVLLLPGMDGTGKLFSRFVDEVPSSLKPVVVDYPDDVFWDYQDLHDMMDGPLDSAEDAVIIAESFSGPLAVRLANDRTYRGIRGIVLVNSFATSPWGRPLGWLPWRMIFKLPVPTAAVGALMLNGKSATDLRMVCNTIATVPSDLLAFRLRMISQVDVREDLRNAPVRVMLLNGRQDRVVPRRCRDEMAKVRPDAFFSEIDGPHLLLQARPADAWRVIMPFIERLPKRPEVIHNVSS